MKLTLDFNCIIALENKEASSKYLSNLLKLHNQNKLDIFVPAISGIEKLPNGQYSNSLSDLISRLEKLSKRPINIMPTLAYLDMWFLDYGIFSSVKLENLDKNIHSILFPNIEYLWNDFVKTVGGDPDVALSKWKNIRCDVITMWCHIYHKNDIFITNDKNFFKPTKYNKLINLGASKILKPKAADTLLP